MAKGWIQVACKDKLGLDSVSRYQGKVSRLGL